MMYCSRCGTVLPNEASFCPQCGARLVLPSAAPTAPVPTASTPLDPDRPAAPSWYHDAAPHKKTSPLAVVGLVLSILSAALSFVHVSILLLWIPAVIFSLLGVFKSTRYAVALIALILCAVALFLIVGFAVAADPWLDGVVDFYGPPFSDFFNAFFGDPVLDDGYYYDAARAVM